MVPSQHACPLANTCNDKNMSSSSEEEDIIHTNEVKFPIGREKFFTTLSYHYFITVKKMTTAMKKRLNFVLQKKSYL